MTEVFFNGVRIMQYDFSAITKALSDDEIEELYHSFSAFWDLMRDAAFKASGDEQKNKEIMDEKIKEIWKGYENLRKIGEEKKEIIRNDSEIDLLESGNYLCELMKEELSPEDYEIWHRLEKQEVDEDAELEDKMDFYDYFQFKTNGYVFDTPDI